MFAENSNVGSGQFGCHLLGVPIEVGSFKHLIKTTQSLDQVYKCALISSRIQGSWQIFGFLEIF